MKYRMLFTGLFLMLLFSCSSVRVLETDSAPGFSLARYETYGFYEPKEEGDGVLRQYENEMNLLKKEISDELESRGLRPSANPELLVNIGAVVEERATTRETNIRDAPRYIGQRRYSWSSEEIVVDTYNLGTVSVELVDREANELVWRGIVEGVVPQDQEKLQDRIEEGVQKLFRRLPPAGLAQ